MSGASEAIRVTEYRGLRNPWVQLAAGIVCMAMIANLQYGWTFFVDPIGAKHAWGRTAIQVGFTIFVLLETWLVPFEAILVDRYGPRSMVLLGGILCGIAWPLDGLANSLQALYFAQAIGGIGAGIVYGTCVGNALKWFARRRGLAAGLTAMGFGAGSALTVIPIQNMIKVSGYEQTLITFGVLQGAVVVIAALFLLTPPKMRPAEAAPPRVLQNPRHYTPIQMLGSPVFYVMYLMFVMVATGGLMATAQLAPLAKDYYIDSIPVTLLFITLSALTWAASIDRVLNGITRPILGWVSDQIGREVTMFLAFLLEGIGILALWKFGASPLAFVLLSGLVFFAWGEIYSIFPATSRDHFGQKFATTNYGLLYTAKGTASLLVPVGSYLVATSGSWASTLILSAALNFVAAISAIAILRPLRIAEIRRTREQAAGDAVVAPAGVPAG